MIDGIPVTGPSIFTKRTLLLVWVLNIDPQFGIFHGHGYSIPSILFYDPYLDFAWWVHGMEVMELPAPKKWMGWMVDPPCHNRWVDLYTYSITWNNMKYSQDMSRSAKRPQIWSSSYHFFSDVLPQSQLGLNHASRPLWNQVDFAEFLAHFDEVLTPAHRQVERATRWLVPWRPWTDRELISWLSKLVMSIENCEITGEFLSYWKIMGNDWGKEMWRIKVNGPPRTIYGVSFRFRPFSCWNGQSLSYLNYVVGVFLKRWWALLRTFWILYVNLMTDGGLNRLWLRNRAYRGKGRKGFPITPKWLQKRALEITRNFIGHLFSVPNLMINNYHLEMVWIPAMNLVMTWGCVFFLLVGFTTYYYSNLINLVFG